MTNLTELDEERLRLSRKLDEGIRELAATGMELAQSENDYRKARAEAYTVAPDGTVDRTKAWVDAHTADLRQRRDAADYRRRTLLEAVRARRTQLSSWQTVANAHKSEADYVRTGP